jgi:osmotically-inducible protein OsmY
MLTSRNSIVIALTFAAFLTACADNVTCGSVGCISDNKLSQDVQARLDAHPELGPPGNIRVEIHDGVTFLTGAVDTGLEKRVAESVATKTPGVKKIVSSIVVEHK